MKKYMLVLAMLVLTVPVAGWCQSSSSAGGTPPASSSAPTPPANNGAPQANGGNPAMAGRPNLDDPAQFKQFKENFIKNIGMRIEMMQKMQTCIQAAKNRQDFSTCMPKPPQMGAMGGRPSGSPNMSAAPSGTAPAAPAPGGATGTK